MIVNIAHRICWKCGRRKYQRIELNFGYYVIKPTILIALCDKCSAIDTVCNNNNETEEEE
jgi:hypothetical protein